MDLKGVLASKQRNAWITYPGGVAYVRRTQRMLSHRRVETFDIASISSHSEDNGSASEFISAVENLAIQNGWTVFVESVFNQKLKDMLKRRGYSPSESYDPGHMFRHMAPLSEARPSSSEDARLIYSSCSRALGGRGARFLTPFQIAGLSPDAQAELWRAIQALERKAGAAPTRQAMSRELSKRGLVDGGVSDDELE